MFLVVNISFLILILNFLNICFVSSIFFNSLFLKINKLFNSFRTYSNLLDIKEILIFIPSGAIKIIPFTSVLLKILNNLFLKLKIFYI